MPDMTGTFEVYSIAELGDMGTEEGICSWAKAMCDRRYYGKPTGVQMYKYPGGRYQKATHIVFLYTTRGIATFTRYWGGGLSWDNATFKWAGC